MKIISFTAENFKRLKVVNITPDGNVIQVTGKNTAGKTSILDAIWATLAGGRGALKTIMPIREGEKKASVRLDLGEYIVTRKWTKNDVGTLTVETPRGAKYQSPQTILDELIGRFAFDPLAFIHQTASEQVQTLVGTLGDALSFNPAELAAEKAKAEAARKEAKKDVADADARIAAMEDVPEGTPEEVVSVSDLLAERNQIVTHNTEVARRRAAVVDQTEARRLTAEQLEYAREEVVRLEEQIRQETQSLADAQLSANNLEEMPLADVDTRLAEVDVTNENVRKLAARKLIEGERQMALLDLDDQVQELKRIAKVKEDGLAAVEFPYPGVSFDDDGVTYNGIPLVQVSGREQLVVSVSLAMAANPELRVLRIDGGEALDSDGLKLIAELAAEKDYQVWMSRVDESGNTGPGVHIIEDGEVAA